MCPGSVPCTEYCSRIIILTQILHASLTLDKHLMGLTTAPSWARLNNKVISQEWRSLTNLRMNCNEQEWDTYTLETETAFEQNSITYTRRYRPNRVRELRQFYDSHLNSHICRYRPEVLDNLTSSRANKEICLKLMGHLLWTVTLHTCGY